MTPAAPPLDPDEARARLLEELAKPEYDDSPGFVQWLLTTLEDWLTDVVNGIDGSSTAQAGIAVLLVLALGVAAVLVLRRTGLIRRSHALSVAPRLDAEPVLSAIQLRRAAHEATQEGRVDDGTVLALRALVRDLEERTLLEVGAGMTAHEAAARAATPSRSCAAGCCAARTPSTPPPTPTAAPPPSRPTTCCVWPSTSPNPPRPRSRGGARPVRARRCRGSSRRCGRPLRPSRG